MKQKYQDAHKALLALSSEKKARELRRFFKTGKGEYGEGDAFLGVMVPTVRRVAEGVRDLPMSDIRRLLRSPYNEERLLALLVWESQYAQADTRKQILIYRAFLKDIRRVNNWNLVDVSAADIVGTHLQKRSRVPLYRLARSKNLWERRIAIVSTFHFIRKGDFEETLALAALFLDDEHDLMHKACGWMLREVGKRDVKALEGFLKKYHAKMPRTMLRYAIERFPPKKRRRYLEGTIQ